MTPPQIKRLHTAFGQLKKLSSGQIDDGWLRTLLRNNGVKPDDTGHVSSKALTNRGLEDVMAIIEQTTEKFGGMPGSYWRDTVARRLGYPTRRQIHMIRELAARQHYDLGKLCKNHSDGYADAPERLTPRQAHNLIEALKKIITRKPTEAA